jgi:hypothetical protein
MRMIWTGSEPPWDALRGLKSAQGRVARSLVSSRAATKRSVSRRRIRAAEARGLRHSRGLEGSEAVILMPHAGRE